MGTYTHATLLLSLCCTTLSAQQAPPAPPVAVSAPQQVPHTLTDGTPIRLRLSQTISSADAQVGQEIQFEVLEDVLVDNVVVLPKGANAIATVTDAHPKKNMGRAGKLDLSISYARLADQEKVALRAVKDVKGGGHTGAMTGAMVATSLVLWPAAPLFLFMHGKDISIPAGTEITAFVQGDMHLDIARFGPAPASTVAGAVPGAAVGQASLVIDSSPPGADIEIDGSFVGSTPSSINVALGSHEIAVKKKGYAAWMRKMNITGGSIHLNADLDKASN